VPATRRKIIEINRTGSVNHTGGTVAIARNGLLYAATGDGGNFIHPARRAPQSKNSLLGRLIRIDPRPGKDGRHYRVRKETRMSASRAATRSTRRGFRNPFRFSIDRNRVLIGDVGEDRASRGG
jgi:glucose/arabinose dehydrogenase